MIIILILKYFDFIKPIIFKINFLNYINNNILFQPNNNNFLYFIIFYNKNYNFIKCNYNIYNKKFLIIIYALKK